jgi:tRNA threonylcarbamoyladenosine biosynthesis protein TsaE
VPRSASRARRSARRSSTSLAERLRTNSAAETEAVGARIGETLTPGDVVLVGGELGVGKTTLIRGASRELGVEDPVTSPTFTIGQRYRGRVPVSHLDLFRIGTGASEEPGLLDEYLTADAIAFVEWPSSDSPLLEPLRGRPGKLVRVSIDHAGGDRRDLAIEGLAEVARGYGE